MKVLVELEIALHQHEVRTDKAQIARLLHREFSEVGESGRTYDFQTIWDSVLNTESSETVIHSQDFECVELSSEVMLLLYKSATLDAQGYYSHFAKRSSIWVLNDGQWQMKYHQGTSCEPFEIMHFSK
jgi:hypothetical protein